MTPEQRIVSREVADIVGKLSRRDSGLLIEFMSGLSKSLVRERARVAELDKECETLRTMGHRSDDRLRSEEARVAELKRVGTARVKDLRDGNLELECKLNDVGRERDDAQDRVAELEARLSRRDERIRDLQKCQDRLRELDKVAQIGEVDEGAEHFGVREFPGGLSRRDQSGDVES